MENLKAALVGMGAMGKNHARVLKALSGIDLVAVYDPKLDVSEQQSELPAVSSYCELINKRPDYCVIATPTYTHEEIALDLASAGISILIEKPIARNLDSANRIIHCVESNGVLGGVGHIERYNAALIEAKRRIGLGELGAVYQILTRRIGPFPARITDVGVVVDLATHDIDLAKWLFDDEYESIAAYSSSRSGLGNEDLVTAVGRLRNGILVSHNINWLSPLKERKIIITGEKGTFVADTLRADLTFYENGSILNSQREVAHFRGATQGPTTIYAFEKPEALVVEHEEFRKALCRESSNYVSLRDATSTLRVAEAMIESSTKNEVVKL